MLTLTPRRKAKMPEPGDCTFIGSVIQISGVGAARVTKVVDDIITVINLDGQSQECYYEDIEYVCTP
jgi:hypothetical protein